VCRRGLRVGVVLALVIGLGPGAGFVRAEGMPQPDRFDTVVIDAGHGGDDEGARGRRGLIEKELVLDVARRLQKRLRAQGLHVVLTRETDVFVPLEARTSVANDARGDLFVSIHANSSTTSSPRGIETFFVSLESSDDSARQVAARENDAFGGETVRRQAADPLVALLGDMIATEHLQESSEFAKLAQGELSKLDASSSRGVKQAPFVVLMGVQMPSALIEIGFLSNAAEEEALQQSKRREKIAAALQQAVEVFGQRWDARRGVARDAAAAGSLVAGKGGSER